MIRFSLALGILCLPSISIAAEYQCVVSKKVERELNYTTAQILNGQFSLKIQESDNSVILSRCSLSPSIKKVTCDKYKVDKVAFDSNVKIKKYYVFDSQFDIQLFKNLSFVENNGRGSVSYGKCQVVSP